MWPAHASGYAHASGFLGGRGRLCCVRRGHKGLGGEWGFHNLPRPSNVVPFW